MLRHAHRRATTTANASLPTNPPASDFEGALCIRSKPWPSYSCLALLRRLEGFGAEHIRLIFLPRPHRLRSFR